MTHAFGTHLGGIRTEEDLKGRCVIDRETGCWHLRTARGRPLPGNNRHIVHVSGLGSISATRAALILRGIEIPPGYVAYRCCGTYDCVLHVGLRTRSEHGLATGRGDVEKKKKANRKAGAKRSRVKPADRARIAYSAEPAAAIARELGISHSWAWTIRQRERAKTIAEVREAAS